MKLENLLSAIDNCEIIARTKAPHLQRYLILHFKNNELCSVEIADDMISRELYARVYNNELITHSQLTISDQHDIWKHIPEMKGKFNELVILKNA